MSLVNQTGESAIVSSRERPIVILQLGMKFTFDWETVGNVDEVEFIKEVIEYNVETKDENTGNKNCTRI